MPELLILRILNLLIYCDIVCRSTFKFYTNSVKIQILYWDMCSRWSIVYFYGICIPDFDNCDTTLCSVKFHRVGDGDITVDLAHTRRPGRKPFWWWKSQPGLLWPESQICRQLFHLQQRQLGNRQVALCLSFQQVPCSVSLWDSFAERRDGGTKQIKLRSPLREMLLFGWLSHLIHSTPQEQLIFQTLYNFMRKLEV